ncbi:rho guanine nucleotide exchange factor 28-like isoform X4 [Mya arenaria]|uniref:rho guanine nucleotide exchange factor 28-like isoform X4 n=1 Tax=Mya arenaria TaxID=6604 RepID=UPI0022E332B7|nr:rho guanine nucleotide exchange factor 28-like isoform X4 [Mya arenaria]
MAFSIKEAPVYGGVTLVVEFDEDTPLSSLGNYYVVYEGSRQRHVTQSRLLAPTKLHSVVPSHSEEEDVLVSVVDFQGPQVSAPLLARGHITFRTDSTFHLAEFLRDSVFHIDSLADLELIKGDNFNIANEELSTLDVRLSRALTYLGFPEWWSLLGNESNSESPAPRESLLHFSARLGLVKVTGFFLRRTGSEACLKLPNSRGHLPRDVALDHGFNGLAELLSEYNLTSLLPIGRWIQREEGRFQTQDTGDVTLTADLQNHHKTLEEDITVLQCVKQQLESEDTDVSRNWQTDWPHQNTQTDKAEPDTDTFKAVCDKAKDLSTLVSVDDYCAPADIYSDPNLDGGHDGGHDDDIEMSEDCDVAMEMDSHDQTEGDEETHDIMEGSISTLHQVSEHLQRIRAKSTVFSKILEQGNHKRISDLRAENLARFSTSCPSLDNESRNSPLPVIDEADHHKSMVDLADDNVGDSGASPASMCSGDVYSSGPDIADGSDGVHIIVDGTTTDSSTDIGLETQEYDRFLNDFYGGNVPQVRRRSFSPQPMKPPVLQEREPDNNNMLIHANKSVNLLPAEEDTDEDSFPSREDVSGSDGNLSGGGDSYRRHLKSDGDAMVTQRRRILQNGETDVNVRGKENNVRYSADVETMMRNAKVRELQGHHSGSHLEAMSSVSRGDGRILSALPHGKITKALSMSSIPAATNADKTKGSGLKGNDKATPSYLLIQKLIAEHDAQFHDSNEPLEEENGFPVQHVQTKTPNKQKPQLSLLDFLNDSSNFTDSGLSSPKQKEEKKPKKPGVFSRFHSSYRIKKHLWMSHTNKEKEGKENKLRAASHRFVQVSFSNATTCDVCRKPLINKPASSCQTCLLNVHDSSCKEHITACDKSKLKGPLARQSSTDGDGGSPNQDKNNGSTGVTSMRSASFRDNSTRVVNSYAGSSTQPLPGAEVPVQPDIAKLQSAAAQLQRHSLPTPRIQVDTSYLDKRSKSPGRLTTSNSLPASNDVVSKNSPSNNHAIAEEGESDRDVSRLDLGPSFNEAICRSTESLDELDSATMSESRVNEELLALDVVEPETWSETADKKLLKKLHSKDIKRQDTIWELIQTEKQYCKRLKALKYIFREGMVRELRMSKVWFERLFPRLDELVAIHDNFLARLQSLQNVRPDRQVEEIGPALIDQFSNEAGQKMKEAYGVFCSGHLEAVRIYKELLAKDRKFQLFIKSCSDNPYTKKREFPDYILLITQRPTKYPVLVEAIIKNTKDKKDREYLVHAHGCVEDVLKSVDQQVCAAERAMKLQEISSRLDIKSYAIHRGRKFKKADVTHRRLLYEGMIGWKNARGKVVEVLAVVLNDVLFFLQDNNQKLSFFSQDNKHGVVSLFNLLVREKRDSKDTKGIYLISQNKRNPEMYEIVFNSSADMGKWAKALREAISLCPEEEEEEISEAEEFRRRQEEKCLEKHERAKGLMEQMHVKDCEIKRLCDEKNRLTDELMAVFNDDDQPRSRPGSQDFEELGHDSSSIVGASLQACVQDVSSQLTALLQGNVSNLSRSVSSVGEHASNTFKEIFVPKRAETFAGFDNHEHTKVRCRMDGADQGDNFIAGEGRSDSLHDLAGDLSRESNESEGDTGHGSSPSLVTSVTSSLGSPQQDTPNITNIIKTLNGIVHLTASQGTAVETLRAQLAEANERINKLSADVHDKKSGYKHNQLEELRNLSGVIQREKEEWERKRDKQQSMLDHERRELEEFKAQLSKQEAEIKAERDKLKKEREVLQKQMDFQRQSGLLPKAQVDLDHYDPSSDNQDSSSDNVQSNPDFVPGHKRSASASESSKSSNGDFSKKTDSNANSTSAKENNFRPEHKSVPKLQSFSFGSGNKPVPVHLLSAANEQKFGSKNVQQLPSKLLLSGASTTSLPAQAIPGMKNSPSGNQSSASLAEDTGSRGDAGQLGHSASLGTLGTSVTVPKGSRQSNRPKPSPLGGGLSTSLLKLAEKGDKKNKSSSSSQKEKEEKGASPPGDKSQRPQSAGNRSGNINHKPQKSDSDVIYF